MPTHRFFGRAKFNETNPNIIDINVPPEAKLDKIGVTVKDSLGQEASIDIPVESPAKR